MADRRAAISMERYPLPELLGRVQRATGPSRELDAQIEVAVRWIEADALEMRADVRAPWRARADGTVDDPWTAYASKPVTGSLDAASALVRRVLPGWWWKVGTCHLSDDACLAPDLSSPTWGKRLKKQLGPIEPDSGGYATLRTHGNQRNDLSLSSRSVLSQHESESDCRGVLTRRVP